MGLFSTIAGIIGGNKAAKSAKKAAQLQYDAAIKGVDETARQFDLTRADFEPYQDLGAAAAPHLGDLVGVNGEDAMAAEIASLRESPLFRSLYRSGEDAILANASATGGLRGGDTQASLYHLGEDTLNSVIAQQLANYSGLVGIGSGASGAVGNFGANAVAQQAALRNQGADAKANAKVFGGLISANNWKNAGTQADSILSAILGGGGGGGGGFSFKSLFG